jgi:hypothetical protein
MINTGCLFSERIIYNTSYRPRKVREKMLLVEYRINPSYYVVELSQPGTSPQGLGPKKTSLTQKTMIMF